MRRVNARTSSTSSSPTTRLTRPSSASGDSPSARAASYCVRAWTQSPRARTTAPANASVDDVGTKQDLRPFALPAGRSQLVDGRDRETHPSDLRRRPPVHHVVRHDNCGPGRSRTPNLTRCFCRLVRARDRLLRSDEGFVQSRDHLDGHDQENRDRRRWIGRPDRRAPVSCFGFGVALRLILKRMILKPSRSS